jgi:hypothetical protein
MALHFRDQHQFVRAERLIERALQREIRNAEQYSAPQTHICPCCGQHFISEYGDKRRLYCSQRCRFRMRKILKTISLRACDVKERNRLSELLSNVKAAYRLIDRVNKGYWEIDADPTATN